MMLLLLSSALRSFLFGLLVWVLLKSLRTRDTAAETIMWTAALLVALSMPVLNHYLPSMSITVPDIRGHSTTPLHQWAEVDRTSLRRLWVADDGQAWLLGSYVLGLMVCLTRLGIGLLRSLRLYARAVPVESDWAGGHDVRVCAALKSPASLGRVILVPADYRGWSAAKRAAVLAHEGAHVARGDFFIQLAASFHCVVFWFSPFAWWLQSKLAEIAETASDEAAVECLDDRVSYAEILLEVACGAQRAAATVAMAKGPFIQQRVERILLENHERVPSTPLRVLLVGSLPLAAFASASITTAIARMPAMHHMERTAPVEAEVKAVLPRSLGTPGTHRIREHTHRTALRVPKVGTVAQHLQTRVSYDPRALLRASDTPIRPYAASTIVNDGKTFYIFATRRPIMEVSRAARAYPQDH